MINYKNTTENLGIVIVSALLGAFICYMAMIKTQKSVTEQLVPALVEAIRKETTKNETNTTIEIKDNKFKKNDSLKIEIIQTPDIQQKSTIEKPVNTSKPPKAPGQNQNPVKKKKKSGFRKFFGY